MVSEVIVIMTDGDRENWDVLKIEILKHVSEGQRLSSEWLVQPKDSGFNIVKSKH